MGPAALRPRTGWHLRFLPAPSVSRELRRQQGGHSAPRSTLSSPVLSDLGHHQAGPPELSGPPALHIIQHQEPTADTEHTQRKLVRANTSLRCHGKHPLEVSGAQALRLLWTVGATATRTPAAFQESSPAASLRGSVVQGQAQEPPHRLGQARQGQSARWLLRNGRASGLCSLMTERVQHVGAEAGRCAAYTAFPPVLPEVPSVHCNRQLQKVTENFNLSRLAQLR